MDAKFRLYKSIIRASRAALDGRRFVRVVNLRVTLTVSVCACDVHGTRKFTYLLTYLLACLLTFFLVLIYYANRTRSTGTEKENKRLN